MVQNQVCMVLILLLLNCEHLSLYWHKLHEDIVSVFVRCEGFPGKIGSPVRQERIPPIPPVSQEAL